MRSGYIAVIGAVVTFVAVVAISLHERRDEPHDGAGQRALVEAGPRPQALGDAASSARMTRAADERSQDAGLAPPAEPPEDTRAMMEAALASPDADVRDEASALSQALNAESSPPGE